MSKYMLYSSNYEEANVLTGAQIRAARAMLGWSADDLSNRAGIARRTLVAIENAGNDPRANLTTMSKIKGTLEAAGIEFIGTPENAPGIRIHAPPK